MLRFELKWSNVQDVSMIPLHVESRCTTSVMFSFPGLPFVFLNYHTRHWSAPSCRENSRILSNWCTFACVWYCTNSIEASRGPLTCAGSSMLKNIANKVMLLVSRTTKSEARWYPFIPSAITSLKKLTKFVGDTVQKTLFHRIVLPLFAALPVFPVHHLLYLYMMSTGKKLFGRLQKKKKKKNSLFWTTKSPRN